MKTKIKKANIGQRGNTLVFVVIVFMVMSILAVSMATIFSANLKQTKRQQDSLEAYYLAYSGALIAQEALLSNSSQKLNELIDNNSVMTVQAEPMGRGSVDIVVELSEDVNFEGWVKITSTAKLDRNDLTTIRTLYFDPANPLDVLWTSN